jgi:hypothetical protein
MRRLMVMVLVLAALRPAAAYAEQERGSANYMLPLCRAWLKIVDKDAEAIKDLLRTDAVVRLTAAGMCAGVVIGVLRESAQFGTLLPAGRRYQRPARADGGERHREPP